MLEIIITASVAGAVSIATVGSIGLYSYYSRKKYKSGMLIGEGWGAYDNDSIQDADEYSSIGSYSPVYGEYLGEYPEEDFPYPGRDSGEFTVVDTIPVPDTSVPVRYRGESLESLTRSVHSFYSFRKRLAPQPPQPPTV